PGWLGTRFRAKSVAVWPARGPARRRKMRRDGSHSVEEIARALGAAAEGDVTLRVTGVAEPADAGPDDLALAMDAKYAGGLAKGGARAAVLWQGAVRRALGLESPRLVGRARLAMAAITRAFDGGPGIAGGIDPR